MRVTRLAARPLRIGLRAALGQRRGLALARPARLAEQPFQLGDAFLVGRPNSGQLGDGRLQARDRRFQLGDPLPSAHIPRSTPPRAISGGPARTARNPRSTRYPSTVVGFELLV